MQLSLLKIQWSTVENTCHLLCGHIWHAWRWNWRDFSTLTSRLRESPGHVATVIAHMPVMNEVLRSKNRHSRCHLLTHSLKRILWMRFLLYGFGFPGMKFVFYPADCVKYELQHERHLHTDVFLSLVVHMNQFHVWWKWFMSHVTALKARDSVTTSKFVKIVLEFAFQS